MVMTTYNCYPLNVIVLDTSFQNVYLLQNNATVGSYKGVKQIMLLYIQVMCFMEQYNRTYITKCWRLDILKLCD